MDMTRLKRMAAKRHPTCQWCGTELHSSRRGRPRKYCSQACRQRAYEQRNAIAGTQIPAEAIILRPELAQRLQDSLFELRCAAEDVKTAVNEGATSVEITQLCNEFVALAHKTEKFRMKE